MRVIKFRVFNTKDKEMITHFKGARIDYALRYWELNKHVSEPMQFTGLKDKNGVDIYESDVLFADGNNSKYTVKYGDYEISSHYDSSPHECTGFYIDRHNGMKFSECESIGGDCTMLSVIGNIHENPELIGG